MAAALHNLGCLLHDTNRLVEAEPLMRRALAINEASYGPDHPDVAAALHKLGRLLHDTNRLVEAEPLMRRAVEILLRFTRASGHHHPSIQAAGDKYVALLTQMGRSKKEALAELDALAGSN